MKTHKRTTKSGTSTPVGIIHDSGRVGLLCYDEKMLSKGLHIYWSLDGIRFDTSRHPLVLLRNSKNEKIENCRDFCFARDGKEWVLTYIREDSKGAHLVTATSKNMHTFTVICEVPKIKHRSVIVEDLTNNKAAVMYVGGLFVRAATTKNLKDWKIGAELLFTSRAGNFDRGAIRLMGAFTTKKGNLLIYDVSGKEGNKHYLQAGAVLLSSDDPKKILWRAELPLWKGVVDTHHHRVRPLAAIHFNGEVMLYWATGDTVHQAEIPAFFLTEDEVKLSNLFLDRHHRNPIIEPHPHNGWENEAVFNPAAVYDNGEVHLIYRAIGSNGVSVFGYSTSKDGLTFRRRLPHPIYEPNLGFDLPAPSSTGPQEYNPLMYTSGGGWGGCEDPRAVIVGDRVYMTYVAFGGWDSIRIALTSISLKDFRQEKWNWKKPIFLSPPKQTHKNWVLFPEKINGKFAVLHGITPEIMVDYVEDFGKMKDYIYSERKPGVQPGRKGFWDSKVRGVGPPPVKTDIGWLVFYHATDQYDPNKYKIGAMILDLNDPSKVLYRTSRPILEPERHYENDGKPGVVYASGAIVKDEHVYVYYGGGDKVVCVATAHLDEFLKDIVQDVKIPFTFKNFKVA